MNMFTKILGLAALLTLAACTPNAVTPSSADAYFLLFAAHTARADVPPPGIGLVSRPSAFVTLAECNKAKDELVKSFTDADGVKWFTDQQVDKKIVVCVPVNF